MTHVTAKIATHAARRALLRVTLASLQEQVDKIEVYCNDYDPPRNTRKIKYLAAPGGDIGDLGKFYQIEAAKDWVLTCDDDIVYPTDYTATMLGYATSNPHAAWGVHACTYPPAPKNRRDCWIFSFTKRLSNALQTNCLGTGTLALQPRTIDLCYAGLSFLWPDVHCGTDFRFAHWCNLNSVPQWAVPREDGWLEEQQEARETAIVRRERVHPHTRLLRGTNFAPIPRPSPAIQTEALKRTSKRTIRRRGVRTADTPIEAIALIDAANKQSQQPKT